MSESRQIGVLVGVCLVLAVLGVAGTVVLGNIGLSGSAVVSSYEARFESDGTLTEAYTYTFTEGDRYRMLYRSWESPVSFSKLGYGYIEPVSINPPLDAVAYAKDQYGDVTIMTPGADSWYVETYIDSLAEYNEAGCFYASYFPAGSYNIDYTFKIHPPIEYDSQYDHLNLMLANVHIPYQQVRVVIENADYVYAVYAHPPSLKVTREGGSIVITGSAAEDELVEVEMLLYPDSHGIDGFYSPVSDVKGKTEGANFWYSLQYYAATWLGYLGIVSVFAVPVLLYFLWSRHGREEDATVPTYLSTVPNKKRKPWLVNLVFRKDIFDFDEDGFYATLLDLHMRKMIKLEPREHGMKIQILDAGVEDPYEKKVMAFLQKLAVNGVFDTDTLNALASDVKRGKGALYSRGLDVKSDLDELLHEADNRVVKGFAVSGKSRLVPAFIPGIVVLVAAFAMMFLAPVVGYMLVTPFITGVVAVFEGVAALMFPSALFGQWRPGMYKEKLEWDAFSNFLGDMAQLKKYGPEDLSMWGEWLVYGTALGVGDNVAKAMKDLNVDIDIARYHPMMYTWFRPIIVASPPSSRSGGGGGFRSGGGCGGGGGFGGGGGGVR